MFAPHHQLAADELLRVAAREADRPAELDPHGVLGELFATMKPYAPPPPPGAQPAPLWGDEDHVRALLGDRVTDVVATADALVRSLRVARGVEGLLEAIYGPTIAVYRYVGDDPQESPRSTPT